MEAGQGEQAGAVVPEITPEIIGAVGEKWRDHFLGDSPLKDDPTLSRFKTPAELAASAVEMRQTMGRWSTEKGILRPKEGAPPEEWNQFYTALGRPEKPEDYEIKAPEKLPEGFPYSPELEGQFKHWAHEEGLSKSAAQNIFNKYLQANVAVYEKATQELQKAVQELQAKLTAEWGDKYQENMALAQKGLREFAPEGSPELAALDKAMGESPVMVKMFYEIGRRMGEAGFVKGPGSAQTSTLQARKEELAAHKAFLDGTHPEHDRVVKEFNQIIKQIVEQEEAREKK